jgi:hypothetical protein
MEYSAIELSAVLRIDAVVNNGVADGRPAVWPSLANFSS